MIRGKRAGITTRYLIKRFVQSLCVMIIVLLITFLVLYVIPGSPAYAMLGKHANAANVMALKEKLGLNRSLPEQFFSYLKIVFSGGLGESILTGKSVADEIFSALPNTLRLTGLAIVFSWVMAMGFSIISVASGKRWCRKLLTGASTIGISIPIFVVALVFQYIFAYKLGWIKLLADNRRWTSYILPALALSIMNAGEMILIATAVLEETLKEDYSLVSASRGATRIKILFHHGLKNASFSVIPVMAMQVSSFLSGAVVTESIFAINGIGRLALDAIYARDIILICGIVLFCTAVVVATNLTGDFICFLFNVKVSRGRFT